MSTPSELTEYNTASTNFHVYAASGPLKPNGDLDFHMSNSGDYSRKETPKKIDLTKITHDQTDEQTKSDNFLKAHGICMAIGWAFFIPLAIVTALLRVFGGSKLFGKDAWFQLHVLFNSLGGLCLVLGVLAIFASNSWQWLQCVRK